MEGRYKTQRTAKDGILNLETINILEHTASLRTYRIGGGELLFW